MTAPTCPINYHQVRGPAGELIPRAKTPAIPAATDLPSLIRTVNIMRDVLRTILVNSTINNVWPGPEPNLGYRRTKSYPWWVQDTVEQDVGFIFYKTKDPATGETVKDEEQRVQVARTHQVVFHDGNEGTNDHQNRFIWSYRKRLDSDLFGRGSEFHSAGIEPMFIEDFFERIINVKWKDYLAVEFGDGAS